MNRQVDGHKGYSTHQMVSVMASAIKKYRVLAKEQCKEYQVKSF